LFLDLDETIEIFSVADVTVWNAERKLIYKSVIHYFFRYSVLVQILLGQNEFSKEGETAMIT
jgi:hypothetical protein